MNELVLLGAAGGVSPLVGPAIDAALDATLPSFLEALEEQHGRLEARADVLD